MNPLGDDDFVHDLVRRVPRLRPLLDEHLEDNFDELLPYVFFGDLTRFVLRLSGAASLGTATSADREVLGRILEELEQGFARGSENIQNLIAVSFLEELPRKGEPDGSEIRSLLGPHLKGELRRQ